MVLHLRQATSEDYELCVQLLHDAEENDERIINAIAERTSTTYLAYDGANVVGAALMHWEELEAEIVYLAIGERMRGQGFGKKIVEALIKEGRSRQVRTLIVGTANSSIDNIAFYQKCGFRMDHLRHDYFSYFMLPVMEDGILTRDMIVFRLVLD